MKIGIIGTGYVGLPAGLCLSKFGNDVICIDKNEKIINNLKNKISPIYEQGLQELLNTEKVNYTTDIKTVENCELIIIAVGTPTGEDGVSADLTYIYDVANELSKLKLNNTIIAIKSTVPVGTNDKVKEIINNSSIKMASYPEFLREGYAIYDFMCPDRIIIGVEDFATADRIKSIYPKAFAGKFIVTDIKSTELIKYASNAFLAIKINYINEIANICEKVGANIELVAKGMGADSRIGNKFLKAGAGYGGSCFPKDTRALLQLALNEGVDMPLVRATIIENEERKIELAYKILNNLPNEVGCRVAILGLAFKENTDDCRESASTVIIKTLLKNNVRINAFDVNEGARKRIERSFNNDEYIYIQDNVTKACEGVDAIVIMNDGSPIKWNEINPCNKLIFDFRGIIDKKYLEGLGYKVFKIGVKD